jgi:Tfp pilus assembly protein PilO
MSARDRLVIALVLLVLVVVVGWIEFVSPERSKVSTAKQKVAAAQAAVSQAQGELAQAESAEARYSEAYAAVIALGKAVPASQEVPALLYELEAAFEHHRVNLVSISAGNGTSSTTTPATSAAREGGFQQLPFTFNFEGTYTDLYHLLQRLQEFAVFEPNGTVVVKGRLLTIDSLNLVPAAQSGAAGKGKRGVLSGTITATAYVLPTGQTLTEGATPAGPRPLPAGSGSSGVSGLPATIKGLP